MMYNWGERLQLHLLSSYNELQPEGDYYLLEDVDESEPDAGKCVCEAVFQCQGGCSGV